MAEIIQSVRETRFDLALQAIAADVVTALGYAAAVVSTVEADGALLLRAFYVDPDAASAAQVRGWQDEIGRLLNRPVDLTDPRFTRVNIHQSADQDNLGVQAAKKRKPVVSDSLFSLLTPVVPAAARPLLDERVQPALGVRQVLAVPFFLEKPAGAKAEIAGILFAAARAAVTRQDERVLAAFGRHAAAALEIERQRVRVLRVARQMSTEIQTRIGQEDDILQQIVASVVDVMGYMGAMLATYEKEDRSLPLRAVCFDSRLEIEKWEPRILKLMRHPISIAHPDPDLARVFVDHPEYQENLSVRAVQAGEPVVSDDLYALFTPFVPAVTRPVFKLVQRTTGINQVIAVPFFLETDVAGKREIVGNLFAATAHPGGFQSEEIELLHAFGQQAAAGIRNARLYREIGQLYVRAEQQRREIEELYRKSDERRQVAELFGKMAFSASANVHALRNHLGAFSTHLQLMLMYKEDPERLKPLLAAGPRYVQRLREASAILDGLHEPWRAQTDRLVALNQAVEEALKKVNDRLNVGERIHVDLSLAAELPPVRTSYEMFVEAFKILIKNGMEAILEKHGVLADGGTAVPDIILGILRLETRALDAHTLEVVVQDNGLGILPENLGSIFDLHWTTKASGMGFGLFWLKDFIEGLGGRVWVESEPGEGTTFRVLLPAAKG